MIYFEGCPNTEKSRKILREIGVNFDEVCLDNLTIDSPYLVYSSPTLLMDEKMVFGSTTVGNSMACSIDLPSTEETLRRIEQLNSPVK